MKPTETLRKPRCKAACVDRCTCAQEAAEGPGHEGEASRDWHAARALFGTPQASALWDWGKLSEENREKEEGGEGNKGGETGGGREEETGRAAAAARGGSPRAGAELGSADRQGGLGARGPGRPKGSSWASRHLPDSKTARVLPIHTLPRP